MPYDQILNDIIYGRGDRDLRIVSPSAPEYTPAWSMYTTNLSKAADLMKQAAPYVPLVETGTVTVVGGGIQAVSFSPGGSGRFWTLHPTGTPSQIDSTLFQ